MANEISVQFGFSVNKPGVTPGPVGPVTTPQSITMNGFTFIGQTATAPITTPAAVDMGSVTNPHASYWINNDPTNYITLQNGLTGAVFARIPPGEQWPIPLDINCVPYVLANTAPVSFTYWIFPL